MKTLSPRSITATTLSGMLATAMLVLVPAPAEAAQVTKWDCKSYYTQVNTNTVRKDTWCTQQVGGSLFPIYGRVKTTKYLSGNIA